MYDIHNDPEISKIALKNIGPKESNKYLQPYIDKYALDLKQRLPIIREAIQS